MANSIASHRKMVNIFILMLMKTNYVMKKSLVKIYYHHSLRVTEYSSRVQDQEGGIYQRTVLYYIRY
jgi:hypothetical protein